MKIWKSEIWKSEIWKSEILKSEILKIWHFENHAIYKISTSFDQNKKKESGKKHIFFFKMHFEYFHVWTRRSAEQFLTSKILVEKKSFLKIWNFWKSEFLKIWNLENIFENLENVNENIFMEICKISRTGYHWKLLGWEIFDKKIPDDSIGSAGIP